LSDRNFLELVYREILGREIDRDGLAIYTKLLHERRNRWEVILFLIRSEEFTNRVLSDNLPPVDIKSRKPENYRQAEDRRTGRPVLTFEARLSEDFDWLEQMIRETDYYERPGVWSFDLDRDKKVMAEILTGFAPQKALEIGCANGAVLKCLHQAGVDIEGVDISARAKTRAFSEIRNRIHLGDFLELALPADPYDLIFGLDIFEHFNPNKIGAYAERIGELVKECGYFYCAIPAFGDDPVFGTVFPLYFREWEEERSGLLPFRTLHVDELGYPIHGHLIWADTSWWVRQFEQAGLVREPSLEKAIHEKYDAYWEVRAKARQSFYVFSKKGEAEINRRVIKAILSSSSTALAGFPGSDRAAR
jgi:SAM-dependent methyltransferase